MIHKLEPAARGSSFGGQFVRWISQNNLLTINLRRVQIRGRKRNYDTGVITAITGLLQPDQDDPTRFKWSYSAQDVAVSGLFEVQFSAHYPDQTIDKTPIMHWNVTDAII